MLWGRRAWSLTGTPEQTVGRRAAEQSGMTVLRNGGSGSATVKTEGLGRAPALPRTEVVPDQLLET